MRRSLPGVLVIALALLLALYALLDVQAYSVATVRSGSTSGTGGYRVVSAPGTSTEKPLVYCSAPYRSWQSNASTQYLPVTCYNGSGHSVSLSVAFAISPTTGRPPDLITASPLSFTVAAGSNQTVNIRIDLKNNTDNRLYTMSYSASPTTTGQMVEASFTFTSQINIFN